jgi:hypothetical protein
MLTTKYLSPVNSLKLKSSNAAVLFFLFFFFFFSSNLFLSFSEFRSSCGIHFITTVEENRIVATGASSPHDIALFFNDSQSTLHPFAVLKVSSPSFFCFLSLSCELFR